MSNKKQTAVGWLIERIINRQNGVINEFPVYSLDQIFDHAKKMEKQQIIDAYHINPLETKWANIGIDYYNETYGGQNYEQ